jgi:hypothetical protein
VLFLLTEKENVQTQTLFTIKHSIKKENINIEYYNKSKTLKNYTWQWKHINIIWYSIAYIYTTLLPSVLYIF